MAKTIDPARLRRLRALAKRSGYELHKSRARAGWLAGTFDLFTDVSGVVAITFEHAERWAQTVPAEDTGCVGRTPARLV